MTLSVGKILGAHGSVAKLETLRDVGGASADHRPVSAADDERPIIRVGRISPSVFDVPVSTHVPPEKTRWSRYGRHDSFVCAAA